MAIIEALDLLLGRKAKPPQLLFGDTKLVLLRFDVAMQEEHIYENRIPQFPIDTSSVISDHIWKQPDQLRLQGQISNAPVKMFFQSKDITSIGVGEDGNRVLSAYEILLALTGRKFVRNAEDNVGKGAIYKPVILDVITNLCVFNNMIIKSLRIPRNAGVKDELMFDIEFVQIAKTTVSDTNIQYVNDKIYGAEGVADSAQPTENVGKQPQTEAKVDNRTVLQRLYDGGAKSWDKYKEKITGVIFGEGS